MSNVVETSQSDMQYILEHPNLNGLNTNLTNSNKWFAHLALEDVLGKKYSDIDLHLVRFSIPQLEMGSMETSYKGYKKQIPTKVLAAETKELTLEYLVDSNWYNYKALYAWISVIEGTLNPVVSTDNSNDGITRSNYLPLRIYLLDAYKKKIIQFVYQNVWIKLFNDISLEANNSGEVTHSITLVYDRFTIEDI